MKYQSTGEIKARELLWIEVDRGDYFRFTDTAMIYRRVSTTKKSPVDGFISIENGIFFNDCQKDPCVLVEMRVEGGNIYFDDIKPEQRED